MNTLPQNIPIQIKELLSDIINSFQKVFTSDLIGIYLHGSLAMGNFNAETSDIDLLVVVKEKLATEKKKAIIDFLIKYSDMTTQKGLEISVLTIDQMKNFKYPTPFELHYSNMWREKYLSGNVDYKTQKYDSDLAAHFTITLHRGICLYGKPIQEVFSRAAESYYLQSILKDAEDIYKNIANDPVYGVLNLCRVLAYTRKKQVMSKTEGGEWGLKNIDKKYQALIKKALDEYQKKDSAYLSWDNDQLKEFVQYIKTLIAKEMSASNSKLRKGTVCFVVQNDKVLLTLIEYAPNDRKWNGIGGYAEKGETLEEAVVREAQEETFISLDKDKLKKVAELNVSPVFQLNVFLTDTWQGELKIKEPSLKELRWFSIPDMPYSQMPKNNDKWVPLILQGKLVQINDNRIKEVGSFA